MRASLRWKNFMLGGLLLIPGTAIAQSTPDTAPKSSPAAGGVGPQELQNFSLSGSVTKPADQQAGPTPSAPAPAATRAADEARPSTAPGIVRDRKAPARETDGTKRRPAAAALEAQQPVPQLSGRGEAAPVTHPLASAVQGPPVTPPLPAASFPRPSNIASAVPLEPEHRLLIWPWIAAAVALLGATVLLLWRRRQQSAFAGGSQFERFVPATPPAPPRPAPAPPRAAAPSLAPEPSSVAPRPTKPASSGIVSTRLRPTLEVEARPLRCLVEEHRVVLEFELELFNSGTAPARAVLAEASLFNAGTNQEQELAAFFANPVGTGERVDAIPPMKRITFVNQVVAPREAIQEYELGGRKVFVPVIAFNALYAWSGGEAQTSTAFLVGRDTTGEKLGPLSLDGGPRQIGKLAARPLHTTLRT